MGKPPRVHRSFDDGRPDQPIHKILPHPGLMTNVDIEQEKDADHYDRIKDIENLWKNHPETSRRKELEEERLKLKALTKKCECKNFLQVLDHAVLNAYYLRRVVGTTSPEKYKDTKAMELTFALFEINDIAESFNDFCECSQPGHAIVEPKKDTSKKITLRPPEHIKAQYRGTLKGSDGKPTDIPDAFDITEYQLEELKQKYADMEKIFIETHSPSWHKDGNLLSSAISIHAVFLHNPLEGCDCSKTAGNIVHSHGHVEKLGGDIYASPFLSENEKNILAEELRSDEFQMILKTDAFEQLCKCRKIE